MTAVMTKVRSLERVVGSSVQRVDTLAKIRGVAEFVGDLDFAGQFVGAVLHSAHPHARISERRRESGRSVAWRHVCADRV